MFCRSPIVFVREIWICVREMSGKCQGILFFPFCMNPARELLKASAFGLGFQQLPRDLANVTAWKNMFDPYNVIKRVQCSEKHTFTNYTSTSWFVIVYQIHVDILGKCLKQKTRPDKNMGLLILWSVRFKHQDRIGSTQLTMHYGRTDGQAVALTHLLSQLDFRKRSLQMFLSSANYGGRFVPFRLFAAKRRHAKRRKNAMRKANLLYRFYLYHWLIQHVKSEKITHVLS